MFGRKKKLEGEIQFSTTDGVAPPKPPLKVALIGGGAKEKYFLGSKYDWTWEIWGLNAHRPDQRMDENRWARIRWARMFNLHRFEHLNRDGYEYIMADTHWAKQHPEIPMYVLDSWHGLLPNEKIFPREQLALQLGPRGGKYHAGSFDLMVAYATSLGAREIAIHGVSLALDSHRSEPISARACLEYWCGYAEARGVRVTAKPDCDIFRQYHLVVSDTTYGFDDVKLVVEARDLHRDPAAYGPVPKDPPRPTGQIVERGGWRPKEERT